MGNNDETKIVISSGNTKLGKIANISLPPITTCMSNAPCVDRCYAMKSYKMYPNVREAWNKNWRLAIANPVSYFNQIVDYTRKHNTPYFRMHVAGDIPNASYLKHMIDIMVKISNVNVLCFTKRYDLVNDLIKQTGYINGKGLTFVLSSWTGLELDNPYGLPVAWYQDGNETRIPYGSINCPGHCASCLCCWELGYGENVVFQKH